MFGALKRGFRSTASLILVSNVVGELQRKRTLAASRGFLAAARLSCMSIGVVVMKIMTFFQKCCAVTSGRSVRPQAVGLNNTSRLAGWLQQRAGPLQ